MTTVTMERLREMAEEAKEELYRLNGGDCPKIYLHWTAGHYWQPFSDYHINILGDGEMMSDCDGLDECLPHTWMRNTGAIGISLCCCVGATTDDLGDEPPTDTQIDKMAKACAVLCQVLDIPPDIDYVMTHGEAADNADGDNEYYDDEDCYGPVNGCERWDLQFLGTEESPEFTTDYEDERTGGNVLRRKIQEYLDVLYEGE